MLCAILTNNQIAAGEPPGEHHAQMKYLPLQELLRIQTQKGVAVVSRSAKKNGLSKKRQSSFENCRFYGGEKGIRTLEALSTLTRFPIVRLRPAQPPLRKALDHYNEKRRKCQEKNQKTLAKKNYRWYTVENALIERVETPVFGAERTVTGCKRSAKGCLEVHSGAVFAKRLFAL